MKVIKTIERVYLNKEEFLEVENTVRLQEHLRRYAAVRRFCYGKVLDFASGCGYGTYLLAANPEVEKVVGVDIDSEAINWAQETFQHEKIEYRATEIKNVSESFDTLVCLETIEHLPDLAILTEVVAQCGISHLIISFPDKKSTHFNKFHVHDFVLQDIADLFPSYHVYFTQRMGDVQVVYLLKSPDKTPSHIFRNIADLK